ncbi:hypothetical protein ABPG72_017628 [Tetrahymena utriculariae]
MKHSETQLSHAHKQKLKSNSDKQLEFTTNIQQESILMSERQLKNSFSNEKKIENDILNNNKQINDMQKDQKKNMQNEINNNIMLDAKFKNNNLIIQKLAGQFEGDSINQQIDQKILKQKRISIVDIIDDYEQEKDNQIKEVSKKTIEFEQKNQYLQNQTLGQMKDITIKKNNKNMKFIGKFVDQEYLKLQNRIEIDIIIEPYQNFENLNFLLAEKLLKNKQNSDNSSLHRAQKIVLSKNNKEKKQPVGLQENQNTQSNQDENNMQKDTLQSFNKKESSLDQLNKEKQQLQQHSSASSQKKQIYAPDRFEEDDKNLKKNSIKQNKYQTIIDMTPQQEHLYIQLIDQYEKQNHQQQQNLDQNNSKFQPQQQLINKSYEIQNVSNESEKKQITIEENNTGQQQHAIQKKSQEDKSEINQQQQNTSKKCEKKEISIQENTADQQLNTIQNQHKEDKFELSFFCKQLCNKDDSTNYLLLYLIDQNEINYKNELLISISTISSDDDKEKEEYEKQNLEKNNPDLSILNEKNIILKKVIQQKYYFDNCNPEEALITNVEVFQYEQPYNQSNQNFPEIITEDLNKFYSQQLQIPEESFKQCLYELYKKEYRISGYINEGGFGAVFKGYHINSKLEVAIKFSFPSQNKNLEQIFNDMNNEKQIIDQIKCYQYVVKTYDLFLVSNVIVQIMEFCSSNLYDYIKQQNDENKKLTNYKEQSDKFDSLFNKKTQNNLICTQASDIYNMGLVFLFILRQGLNPKTTSQGQCNKEQKQLEESRISFQTFAKYYMLCHEQKQRYTALQLKSKLIYYFPQEQQSFQKDLQRIQLLIQSLKKSKQNKKYIAYLYFLSAQHSSKVNEIKKSLKLAQSIDQFPKQDLLAIYSQYSYNILNFEKSLKVSKMINYQNLVLNKCQPNQFVAEYLSKLAFSYSRNGNDLKALEFDLRAQSVRDTFYDVNHPSLAESLSQVGISYERLGNDLKASECFKRALNMRKALYEGNHPEIGNYQDALKFQFKALRMKEVLYEGFHQDIASSLSQISISYERIGKDSEALEYSMRKALYEGNNLEIAKLRDNQLALEALECFKRALKIREVVYIGMHPDIAQSLSHLGISYLNLSDYEKAEIFLVRSLSMRQELYKGNHPDLAESLSQMGFFYTKISNIDLAYQYYSLALIMREALYKGNHPDTVQSLFQLALILERIGSHSVACMFYQEAFIMKDQLNLQNDSADTLIQINY